MVKKMNVAIVGPPHSGKSVFLSVLYSCLREKNASFFLQRACPDGEGMWSSESDQEVVKMIRRKGTFDEKFVNFTLDAIKKLAEVFEIVLVDCGGLITEENRMIISECTDFVVISSSRSATFDWINFCQSMCGANCLAVFDSTLEDSVVPNFDPESKFGTLVGLDRNGVNEDTKVVISEFANYLVEV